MLGLDWIGSHSVPVTRIGLDQDRCLVDLDWTGSCQTNPFHTLADSCRLLSQAWTFMPSHRSSTLPAVWHRNFLTARRAETMRDKMRLLPKPPRHTHPCVIYPTSLIGLWRTAGIERVQCDVVYFHCIDSSRKRILKFELWGQPADLAGFIRNLLEQSRNMAHNWDKGCCPGSKALSLLSLSLLLLLAYYRWKVVVYFYRWLVLPNRDCKSINFWCWLMLLYISAQW